MLRARRPGSPRGAAGHGDRVACPRGGASHRTTRPPQSAWRGMPVCSPCVLALNRVPLVPVLWNPRAFVSRYPVAGINAQRYPNPLRQSLRRRGSPTRFVRGERHDLSPAHTVSVVGPTALCVGGDLCRCRPSRAGRLHRRLSRKGLFADSGRARAQAASSSPAHVNMRACCAELSLFFFSRLDLHGRAAGRRRRHGVDNRYRQGAPAVGGRTMRYATPAVPSRGRLVRWSRIAALRTQASAAHKQAGQTQEGAMKANGHTT